MANFLVRTLIDAKRRKSGNKLGKPGTGVDNKSSPQNKTKNPEKKKVIPQGEPEEKSADKPQGKQPEDKGKPEEEQQGPQEQHGPKQQPGSGMDVFDPGKKGSEDKKDENADDDEDDEDDEDYGQDLKPASFKNLAKNVNSMDNPHYFIISGRNAEDKLNAFLSENETILKSKNAYLFYKGTKNELDKLYFWFISGPEVKNLEDGAKKANLPYSFGQVPKAFFSEDTPFNSIKLSDGLRKSIGNEEAFRKSLNIQWNKARSAGTPSAGAFPSFQMNIKIDVNYLRFFNKQRREYEIYTGNQVPNAGQTGFMYPLVSAKEAKGFMKFFQNFIMPAPFYRDMFELSDIDPDFKTVEPTKITPAYALILLAKKGEKFDPKDQKQLEKLEQLAQEQGAPKIAPKFGNTQVLMGTHNVHFSKDFTKAIVWCGHQKKAPPPVAEVTQALPFVEGYDDTFL